MTDVRHNQAAKYVLNIVPVSFSADTFVIGRTAYTSHDDYLDLQDEHWRTHAFRYDTRFGEILNVPLVPEAVVLGQAEEVEIGSYLLLAARAIQQAMLLWIAGKRPVIKASKQLMFWGQADEALLLSSAVTKAGLKPISDIEVPLRYEIDCRMFADSDDRPYLGLVIDIQTSNMIDIPVSELLPLGLSVEHRYVCRRRPAGHPYLHPNLDLLGRVVSVHGSQLEVVDADGSFEVAASEVLLEPRLENLQAAIEVLYGNQAGAILSHLRGLRQPVSSAAGKLARIKSTLSQLQRRRFTIANSVEVEIGELLDNRSPDFPATIETGRPTFLFGAQGRDKGEYPDMGIRTWGPYMYMHHSRSAPLIAVLCESRHRGTVEQFVDALCNGFPDALWQGKPGQNPYRGGLQGKFRLTKVRLEYEECASPAAQHYRVAAKRLLERVPRTPDLALVQIREAFMDLPPNDNPYFVTKALFMSANVPTQAVRIEKIDGNALGLPYLLNNVALASYAKLDGIPWVISTRGTTTHELVIGIGSAEVSTGRLEARDRYVGITTVFQGDGRYLVWGITREVPAEDYADELLHTLRGAIRHVQSESGWEAGDKVRLICHVYKRLKNSEVDAIKALVRELLDGNYAVEFAFLDVSTFHPYRLMAPFQRGVRGRGKGVPDRGICLQLDKRRVLLHLTGPSDLKTDEQGLPKPLLIELHPDSDLTDLAFLSRQVYHFTYASWQSFHPATEPVTIKYSRMIADLLGNLRLVRGWDSTVLSVGGLRERRWFL